MNLPEDNMIYIRSCSGFCHLLVWSHNVLHLTVLVESEDGSDQRFSEGIEAVLIVPIIPTIRSQSSVLLFDSSNEELFRLLPAPGDDSYPSFYLK